jgi:hypothetical protein
LIKEKKSSWKAKKLHLQYKKNRSVSRDSGYRRPN